ncbi:MAG: redox-regulated ATPase YchF [bacterium]|nr:redox-regulated ATPase YchF [bacterium]
MKIGIVGLPNVGKTTVFNALTNAHAPSENYPFCTIDPNRGAVAVPDARLARLAAVTRPSRVIPAHVEFIDVAGLVEGASRGEGLGNRFLSHVREAHAVAQVVRCFEEGAVACGAGGIDPAHEIGVVAAEFAQADLQILERAGRRSAPDRARERAVGAMRAALAAGRPLRDAGLDASARACAAEFGLLTLKPLIVVANVGEARSEEERRLVGRAEAAAAAAGARCLEVCGKLEAELADLPPGEAAELAREMGLRAGALPRLIAACEELLGLITFFTLEGGIVQARAVPAGTTAPRAAGRVHSDMERGFVRAEVIAFEDLDRFAGWEAARAAGAVRIEGSGYAVRDGDVVRFRFAP